MTDDSPDPIISAYSTYSSVVISRPSNQSWPLRAPSRKGRRAGDRNSQECLCQETASTLEKRTSDRNVFSPPSLRIVKGSNRLVKGLKILWKDTEGASRFPGVRPTLVTAHFAVELVTIRGMLDRRDFSVHAMKVSCMGDKSKATLSLKPCVVTAHHKLRERRAAQ